MSTIMIDGLMSAGVVLSLGLIYFLSKPIGNKNKVELLMRFNELSEKNNLTITNKEMFGNLIIGMDSLENKLLILRRTGDREESWIISLSEIKGCSIKKIYKNSNAGTDKIQKHEDRLDRIVVEFDSTDEIKQTSMLYFGLAPITYNRIGTAMEYSENLICICQNIDTTRALRPSSFYSLS